MEYPNYIVWNKMSYLFSMTMKILSCNSYLWTLKKYNGISQLYCMNWNGRINQLRKGFNFNFRSDTTLTSSTQSVIFRTGENTCRICCSGRCRASGPYRTPHACKSFPLPCHYKAWVKVLRINPEFRILRLTFHRKSASKCWIKQIIIASRFIFNLSKDNWQLNFNLLTFCRHKQSF